MEYFEKEDDPRRLFLSELIDCKNRVTKMPKKPSVRILMDSQQVKRSESLPKSARQYLCNIFWSLWREISSKSFVLVVSELLILFDKILTPDDKYCPSVKASVYCYQFKCSYLNIKKYFLKFFLHFWNLHQFWNTLK